MAVMATFGLFSLIQRQTNTPVTMSVFLHVVWICANIFNTEQCVGGDVRPLKCSKKSNAKSQTGVAARVFL